MWKGSLVLTKLRENLWSKSAVTLIFFIWLLSILVLRPVLFIYCPICIFMDPIWLLVRPALLFLWLAWTIFQSKSQNKSDGHSHGNGSPLETKRQGDWLCLCPWLSACSQLSSLVHTPRGALVVHWTTREREGGQWARMNLLFNQTTKETANN